MTASKKKQILVLAAVALLGISCRDEKPKKEDTIKADKRVKMLTRDTGDQKPFFRATLKLKNPDGTDAENVKLHTKQEELRKAIKIGIWGKKATNVFYVATSAQESEGSAQSETNHDLLLLFDVSGSMKEKDIQPDRFTAAKLAAKDLVTGLSSNYRVAIVPFESHKVQDEFNKAQFRLPQEAIADIDSLRAPGGNTALYDAIDKALEVLKKRNDDGKSQDQSLIVLTDGKNDVKQGDDPGLLGDKDYPALLTKLRKYNTRTFTIGLGNPNKGGKNDLSFEEDKLQELASTQGQTRYYKADNLNQLKSNFAAVQKSVKNILTVSFCTDDKDLHDLRSLKFDLSYTSLDGKPFNGAIRWVCRNSVTGCVPSPAGKLDQQENAALDKSSCDKEGLGAWQQILWLFGQLALFSGGIVVLWMFVPNLIWPSVPLPSLPSRGKQKSAPPQPKPSPRPSSSGSSGQSDHATPARPRQRFEETRIYDKPARRNDPRGRQ